MPDGFFAAEPLKSYIAAQPHHRFVRISDLFSNRSSLIKSAFYRRYMAPQKCAHGVCLSFWKDQRIICVIAIMRTATQGNLSLAELKLLQQFYRQFLTALCRLRLLEREHSLRMDLEEFLSRLPMPTILLRWNLKPIYQNRLHVTSARCGKKDRRKRNERKQPPRFLPRSWIDAICSNNSGLRRNALLRH
jgi:hypothetical protein